jgi:hypothetical protein
MTVNHGVVGSSPTRGAEEKGFKKLEPFLVFNGLHLMEMQLAGNIFYNFTQQGHLKTNSLENGINNNL